jgi:hypothetical protein
MSPQSLSKHHRMPVETIPSANFQAMKEFVVVGALADCLLRLHHNGARRLRIEDRGFFTISILDPLL